MHKVDWQVNQNHHEKKFLMHTIRYLSLSQDQITHQIENVNEQKPSMVH